MLDELWTGVFEEADGKTDPDAVPENNFLRRWLKEEPGLPPIRLILEYGFPPAGWPV
jgi:hypothetical protein